MRRCIAVVLVPVAVPLFAGVVADPR